MHDQQPQYFSLPGPDIIIIIKPWQNKAQKAEVSPVSIMIATLNSAD